MCAFSAGGPGDIPYKKGEPRHCFVGSSTASSNIKKGAISPPNTKLRYQCLERSTGVLACLRSAWMLIHGHVFCGGLIVSVNTCIWLSEIAGMWTFVRGWLFGLGWPFDSLIPINDQNRLSKMKNSYFFLSLFFLWFTSDIMAMNVFTPCWWNARNRKNVIGFFTVLLLKYF